MLLAKNNFIHILHSVTPKVVVEWLTLLLRIREAPVSILGPRYPEVFHDFLQSLQANVGTVPRPLPTKSFPIHHSLITLPSKAHWLLKKRR
jgi:hypothetical protein